MGKKPKSIGFQLKGISSNQFAIIEDLYIQDDEPKLNASFSYAFEGGARMITCRAKFTFTGSKGIFMIIEGSCHFIIESLSWQKMLLDDNKIKVDKSFALHITSLTIGTVRGMLHAKTEQTVYNLIFIPTINMQDILSEDVILGD